MTVAGYYSDDENDKRLTCTWFDDKKELKSSTFLEDQLELDE